uniref:uncharacterized protein n=1 Tax=Myxine glutinosa TaxID=7769 RepID=UPI00358EF936
MSWSGDSEKKRWICRIMAIAFRVARDQTPGIKSQSWVAKYLNRYEDFVKRNWNRDPFDCEMDSRPEQTAQCLSRESRDIIIESLAKEKKSIRGLQKEIERVRGKKKSLSSIHRFLQSIGAKTFHQIPAPKLTEKNVEDRMWFCEFLSEWTSDDFLFLAPSNEFSIYEDRRPNFQNDRMWALHNDDIPQELKIREKSKTARCVGVFLMFRAKRLMWVIEEQGQSWDGKYLRDVVLTRHVIPFLRNPENVLSIKETTFLHDRAPCMSALVTQNLLKANKVDFFGNDEWPEASPDLNACEHLGAIHKDRVEQRLQNTREELLTALTNVLEEMEFDRDLFVSLLESYPTRLEAVRSAGGGHTKY